MLDLTTGGLEDEDAVEEEEGAEEEEGMRFFPGFTDFLVFQPMMFSVQ